MIKKKTNYINAEEQKGELSLSGLIKQTKPKEEYQEPQHKKVEREVLKDVFD